MKIEKSRLNINKGLIKRGYDNLIINNSELRSKSGCLNLSGKFDVYCKNILLQSKDDFSIKASNNTNIIFESVNIKSNSGFLCNGVNCSVSDLNANIFVKFLDISDSKFNINNSKIVYKIPKQFVSLSNKSNLLLNNTEINFSDDDIYLQYFDDSFLINLKQNSNLIIHELNAHIKYSNNLSFLKSEADSFFNISKVIIRNFDKFIKMQKVSFGIVMDSLIDIKSSVSTLFQETSLMFLNCKIINLSDYKFDMKDMSRLYLYNTEILKNKFLIMTNLSQVVIYNNFLNLSGEICKLKDFSLFRDFKSTWSIDKVYNKKKKYVFYLQNGSEFVLNLSKIDTRESLIYAIDNVKLNVKNTYIANENKGLLMLIRDKASISILKSEIHTFSFAKIKNYASVIINNSYIYTKSSVLKLFENSKIIINKSFFKNKGYSKRGIAFEKFNNSMLKISDSTINNFKVGIKYDSNENININNSNMYCEDKIVFSNDKRYFSITKTSRRKLLYKLQQFVVSTTDITLLNKIYKFIKR